MFCNVRRYRVAQSEMDDLMHRVDTEFCEMVEHEPGFVAYQALDCGDGTLVTITTFRDEDAAEQSATTAANFVRERLEGYTIERLDAWNGAVKVNRAVEEVLEAAHA